MRGKLQDKEAFMQRMERKGYIKQNEKTRRGSATTVLQEATSGKRKNKESLNAITPKGQREKKETRGR